MKENEMVFGIRAVIEAIQADKEVDKVLVKRDLQGDLSKELFEVLRGREIPVQRVPAERLDRLTRKNHQGVIAFMSAVTYQSLEDIIPFVYEQGKDPFIVLLDGVTDVRNFGAIARTCECAGVDAIVIPAKGSVSVNAERSRPLPAPCMCCRFVRRRVSTKRSVLAAKRGEGICRQRESGGELYGGEV